MRHRRLTRHRQAGFNLAEVAVVLLVVGILLGSGVMVTNDRLEAARDAIIGFAVLNSRLPRPAVSATNGAEKGDCISEADCTGFIPWAALGVERLDGFDKLIRYSVTPSFANASFFMTSVPTKTVVTRNQAGVLTYMAGAATCNLTAGCTPAIIYSAGKTNFGTTVGGIGLPTISGSNTDEITNNAAIVQFISRDFSANRAAPGGEFDDQVLWISHSMLLARLVQSGRLP
jgi:prepilin-type N-terminal cleavage/methylation domain-containing protein